MLLKIVKAKAKWLYNGKQKIKTYAILGDGAERTILLHPEAEELGLQGSSENLIL